MTEHIRTGVLVMAQGPAAASDLAWRTAFRGGPPAAGDIVEHYRMIGGRSPVAGITSAQAEGLADELRLRGHDDLLVAVGMLHAPPFIEDVAAGLADLGVQRVIGLVLAPQETRTITGACGRRAESALGPGVEFDLVRSWATAPAYVGLLADEVAAALERADGDAEVLFTARSVPLRSVSGGDPYAAELRATAEAVAAAAGATRWSIAWQSSGGRSVSWLGPDVADAVREIADDGRDTVIVCPAGFLADDLDVLYDLDLEVAGLARDLGLTYLRTATPNDDPRLIEALADAVEIRLAVRA